jgi:hypothetical protein
MSIRYLPKELLKKIAPKKAIEKLVTNKLTLNKTALSMISKADVISKESVTNVALKVIKQYKKSFKDKVAEGAAKSDALEETLNDRRLLTQRVQNNIIFQIKEEIADQYAGEFYIWLPSSADVPSPIHQLNYGGTFQIGVGEMPGDRFGCQCGMQILVPGKKLQI